MTDGRWYALNEVSPRLLSERIPRIAGLSCACFSFGAAGAISR
ncbi:hypothetical protein [Polyangium sorediatum]|uniref:Uncharacterized protein n=1 Tax=Polyangium sorediatum TaxID=889274 RepID=A0ABT6P2Z9_9BACT|nr:hypothetical protein [Polyangium sorediatum]MDI1434984.1 hypothetical protein [Polyangium sorediatum]